VAACRRRAAPRGKFGNPPGGAGRWKKDDGDRLPRLEKAAPTTSRRSANVIKLGGGLLGTNLRSDPGVQPRFWLRVKPGRGGGGCCRPAISIAMKQQAFGWRGSQSLPAEPFVPGTRAQSDFRSDSLEAARSAPEPGCQAQAKGQEAIRQRVRRLHKRRPVEIASVSWNLIGGASLQRFLFRPRVSPWPCST